MSAVRRHPPRTGPGPGPQLVALAALAGTATLLLAGHAVVGTVPAFLPAYLAVVLVLDLLSTALLLGRYLDGADHRLLVVAAAYLWSAASVVPHALVFPGLFGPTGLLGAVPSSAVWLWTVWHLGFVSWVAIAAVPLPAALEQRLASARRPARAATAALLLAGEVALVAALTWLVTSGAARVPTVIVDGDYSALTERFGPALLPWAWGAAAAAVVGLGARGRAGDLGRWAAAAAVATAGDVTVTMLARERFSIGWYGARVLAVVSAVVLLSLVRQLLRTQREVAGKAAELAAANACLQEANARLAAATAARERIIGVVSHELANPLTALAGFLDVTLEHGRDDPAADAWRPMVERCRALTGSLTMMAEDLLTGYAQENEALTVGTEAIELPAALVWLAEQHLAARLVIDCPWEAVVLGDPARLQQVLGNLVRNAVKYGAMPVTVRVRRSGDLWDLAVTDAGAGVPAADVDRLFERFHRAAASRDTRPGVGLGLPIARDLARLMGGDLGYEASTRSFHLQLRDAVAPPAVTPAVTPPAPAVTPSAVAG